MSTCQRRFRSPTVWWRKRTSACPFHVTGLRRISFSPRFEISAARSPTHFASRSLRSAAANPATAATNTPSPISATVCRSGFFPPWTVRRASAITGKPRITNWFQTPVTATASVTAAGLKPHFRSIPNDSAIPTAGPPGATTVRAVDACVTTNAWRKRSPGSAAIQGGANVARLSTVAPPSRAKSCHENPLTTSHTEA